MRIAVTILLALVGKLSLAHAAIGAAPLAAATERSNKAATVGSVALRAGRRLDSSAETVAVDATMHFAFFEGSTLYEPNESQFKDLMAATASFYDQYLKAAFPSLTKTVATMDGSCWMEENIGLLAEGSYPLQVDFTVSTTFDSGTDLPSIEDVWDAMEAADHQVYIPNYVWQLQVNQDTPFFDTQAVFLNPRLEDECTGTPPPPNVTDAGGDPIVERVQATMHLAFFPEVVPRALKTWETGAFIDATGDFYRAALKSAFPEVTIVEALLIDTCFDDSFNWPLQVDFELGVEATEERFLPSQEAIWDVMEAAEYIDYIVSYIWPIVALDTSDPTILFETQAVHFGPIEKGCEDLPTVATRSGHDDVTVELSHAVAKRAKENPPFRAGETCVASSTAAYTTTLKVHLTFTYFVEEGKSLALDADHTKRLVENTVAFFNCAILKDDILSEAFIEWNMRDVHVAPQVGRKVVLTADAAIEVDSAFSVTNRQAMKAMMHANLDQYLMHVVQREDKMFKVIETAHIKAVAHGGSG